jgi:hypothetical protein
VHTTFGAYLKGRIDELFPSQRAFIRAAEGANRINSGQGYLSQVIAGKKPPPIKRLDAWAKALELSEAEKERFLDLACIAHMHPLMRARLEKMFAKVAGRDGRTR